MGAVMSEDSLNALGKFDDSIQRLKAGSAAAKNMLVTVLLSPTSNIGRRRSYASWRIYLWGCPKRTATDKDKWGHRQYGGRGFVSMLMENLPKSFR